MKNITFDFPPPVYEKILRQEFLSNREKAIIELKRNHFMEWTNERIAMELNISSRQLQRELKKLTYKLLKYII